MTAPRATDDHGAGGGAGQPGGHAHGHADRLPGVAVGGVPARPGTDLPAGLLDGLVRALGREAVITEPGSLLVYESDGLTAYRARPVVVVLPRDTEDVATVVKLLSDAEIPFVARGAGTGLSGGAVAVDNAAVISLARMDRILDLDPVSRRARVQPGVVNVELSAAAAPHGLYYAPDPSSQTVCTIGGNVAENAGGPHCLKYGVTANHVVGLKVVLPDGSVSELRRGEDNGLDLVGLFVGSEGTFGIATEIDVRLLPVPEAVETLLALFDDIDDASRVVSAIIGSGLLPAALEMVDREAIMAVEASAYAAGTPTDVAGALVIEFDGPSAEVQGDAARAEGICREGGARDVQRAADEADRQRLWHARKKAFGAMGRIAPDVLVQDAVVPRSRLPEVLRSVYEIAGRYELRMCNMFHAGDGNLHPTIVFDRRDPGLVHRVEQASAEMMKACVDAGGTITGEHGVGMDKRDYMQLVFSPAELDVFCSLRRIFDPCGLANPAKILPVHSCREWVGPATRRVPAVDGTP
ncbi:MAG TPA: FAD-linked oxidase C-terminal domain-containing protein [Longimicrobiales bacterium]|nr:FAD-linked oxidase C-terminal domain-containing protein [Longimicrobiales bacterium]